MRQAQVQVAGSGAGADTTARPTFQPQSWISTPGHKLPLSSRRGQMKACTPWSSRAPLPSGEGTCGRAGRQAGRGAGGQAGEGEEVQQDAERWPESTSAAACFVCPCACSDCRPSRPATLQQHSP